jgi:hypothetical protein
VTNKEKWVMVNPLLKGCILEGSLSFFFKNEEEMRLLDANCIADKETILDDEKADLLGKFEERTH